MPSGASFSSAIVSPSIPATPPLPETCFRALSSTSGRSTSPYRLQNRYPGSAWASDTARFEGSELFPAFLSLSSHRRVPAFSSPLWNRCPPFAPRGLCCPTDPRYYGRTPTPRAASPASPLGLVRSLDGFRPRHVSPCLPSRHFPTCRPRPPARALRSPWLLSRLLPPAFTFPRSVRLLPSFLFLIGTQSGSLSLWPVRFLIRLLSTPPHGDAVGSRFRREQPNSAGGTFIRVDARFASARRKKTGRFPRAWRCSRCANNTADNACLWESGLSGSLFPLSGQRLPRIDKTYIVCLVSCVGLSLLLRISS